MKEGNESSLADFVFDDEEEFNFAATSGNPTEKVKEVADHTKLPPDFDKEEGGEEAPTNLDEAKKVKPKEEEKEEPKTKKKLVEAAEEAVEDEDFAFGEEVKPAKKKEKVEDEGEEETAVDSVPEKFYTNLAMDLRDRGTLSLEIDENRDYSVDEFFELQEAEIEARFNETLDAFKEEFDEDGKEYLRWKKNGGSTKEFITDYLAPSFTIANFDDSNQGHIDRTIDHYLRNVEGLEDDDLDERKRYIKDSGKEKGYAASFYKKLEKVDTERKEELQKILEVRAKKEQEEELAFNEEIIDTLKEIRNVGSFYISDTDRKGLGNYITKPAVKIGKNKYIPKFQHDLRNILVASNKENKRKLLILAKIVANDFNLKDLEQKVETKVTKGAKARISSSSPRGVTGGSSRTPQLADFIDD